MHVCVCVCVCVNGCTQYTNYNIIYIYIYIYIYIFKEIYYQESACAITGLANCKVCSMSWQAGDLGEPMSIGSILKARRFETQEEFMFQFVSKFTGCQAGRIVSYLGDGQPFCSFKTSQDWRRCTHIVEGNPLYSVH